MQQFLLEPSTSDGIICMAVGALMHWFFLENDELDGVV